MVIENTAFAADVALHFPSIFHKLYDNNRQWQLILESSIALVIRSGLPDDETLKAVNLVRKSFIIKYKSLKKLRNIQVFVVVYFR